MTILTCIKDRLRELGLDSSIDGDELHINTPQGVNTIKQDDVWADAYNRYRQARSFNFDNENRMLVHNNFVEIPLVSLSSFSALSTDQQQFLDTTGNKVVVGSGSNIFSLAFFHSPDYARFFEAIVSRRLERGRVRRVADLMWTSPITAAYIARGRRTPPDLVSRALSAINRCLFKIAVEQHDSLIIFKPSVHRLRRPSWVDYTTIDYSIPSASYDETVVSYYKVAKASPFPSQSFMAYYNVLEYYFLTVSENNLQHRLAAMLNDPKFNSKQSNIERLISAVRSSDARLDEKEMLLNVLSRYVQENELIEFINSHEAQQEEKTYSKKRKVFGENIEINPRAGHALSNTANALKHIRNAIVHSSDKYSREECHTPLSETENIIEEFLPLVRFFAEKIIYGTAT